jgi:hypothetical protein
MAPVRSDLPTPLPSTWRLDKSPSGNFGVITRPGTLEVFGYDFVEEVPVWRVEPRTLHGLSPKDFFGEVFFPMDDGQHLAVVRNPLATDADPPDAAEPVIYFLREGEVTRHWTLGELTPEHAPGYRLPDGRWRWLALAVSHPDKLVIETWNCWWLTFSLPAGELLDSYEED